MELLTHIANVRRQLADSKDEKLAHTLNILILLLDGAQKAAKKRKADATDQDVRTEAVALTKRIRETIEILKAHNKPVAVQEFELFVVDQYLPVEITETQLREAVSSAMVGFPTWSPRQKGTLITNLTAALGPYFDKKLALAIADEIAASWPKLTGG